MVAWLISHWTYVTTISGLLGIGDWVRVSHIHPGSQTLISRFTQWLLREIFDLKDNLRKDQQIRDLNRLVDDLRIRLQITSTALEESTDLLEGLTDGSTNGPPTATRKKPRRSARVSSSPPSTPSGPPKRY